MAKLKEDDKKLLNLLQKGDLCVPRITKLAHKLGLPTSTVQTKLNNLERDGYIKGYSVELDPKKCGRGLPAFWIGSLKHGPKIDMEQTLKRMEKIPNVQSVMFTSGDKDFLIRAQLRDPDEYYEIAKHVADSFEGYGGTGFFSPKYFKDTHKFVVD